MSAGDHSWETVGHWGGGTESISDLITYPLWFVSNMSKRAKARACKHPIPHNALSVEPQQQACAALVAFSCSPSPLASSVAVDSTVSSSQSKNSSHS